MEADGLSIDGLGQWLWNGVSGRACHLESHEKLGRWTYYVVTSMERFPNCKRLKMTGGIRDRIHFSYYHYRIYEDL